MEIDQAAIIGKYVGATLACSVLPFAAAVLGRMPRNRWLGLSIGTLIGTVSMMLASGVFWPRAAG